MKNLKIPALIFSISLPLFAGFIGSVFTAPAIGSWYITLIKPSWNPPNWLFAPVWALLYILIGIALYIVITTKAKTIKSRAYTFFGCHLHQY